MKEQTLNLLVIARVLHAARCNIAREMVQNLSTEFQYNSKISTNLDSIDIFKVTVINAVVTIS